MSRLEELRKQSKELSEQDIEIKNKLYAIQEELIKEEYNEVAKLVGKCYALGWGKYCKIISPEEIIPKLIGNSDFNPYRVQVVRFCTDVTDVTDCIELGDPMISDLKKCKEITKEEFNEKYLEYIEKFNKILMDL